MPLIPLEKLDSRSRRGRKPFKRPAELGQVGVGALVGACLILFDIGLSPEKIAALTLLVSTAAGIVTWAVERFRSS